MAEFQPAVVSDSDFRGIHEVCPRVLRLDGLGREFAFPGYPRDSSGVFILFVSAEVGYDGHLLPDPDAGQLGSRKIAAEVDVPQVGYLEKRPARSGIFALFGIFLQHNARYGGCDVALAELFFDLFPLVVQCGGALGDGVAALVEAGEQAFELSAQGLQLGVCVVVLFLSGRAVGKQACEAAAFALLVGNLRPQCRGLGCNVGRGLLGSELLAAELFLLECEQGGVYQPDPLSEILPPTPPLCSSLLSGYASYQGKIGK